MWHDFALHLFLTFFTKFLRMRNVHFIRMPFAFCLKNMSVNIEELLMSKKMLTVLTALSRPQIKLFFFCYK